LRSPSQQVCEGQAGAVEPIVEADAEVVQRNPRRQTRPQTLKLVGPLFAKPERSVQLLVEELSTIWPIFCVLVSIANLLGYL
jgi:hypothetical protein